MDNKPTKGQKHKAIKLLSWQWININNFTGAVLIWTVGLLSDRSDFTESSV